MYWTRLAFLAFLGASLTFLITEGRAQVKELGGSPCDPGLKQDSSSLGYKPRGGNRCEGYYIQPVAGGRLEIESFTRGSGVNLIDQTELTLKWPSLGKEPVQIRAYSLKAKEYYRMDTTRPS